MLAKRSRPAGIRSPLSLYDEYIGLFSRTICNDYMLSNWACFERSVTCDYRSPSLLRSELLWATKFSKDLILTKDFKFFYKPICQNNSIRRFDGTIPAQKEYRHFVCACWISNKASRAALFTVFRSMLYFWLFRCLITLIANIFRCCNFNSSYHRINSSIFLGRVG